MESLSFSYPSLVKAGLVLSRTKWPLLWVGLLCLFFTVIMWKTFPHWNTNVLIKVGLVVWVWGYATWCLFSWLHVVPTTGLPLRVTFDSENISLWGWRQSYASISSQEITNVEQVWPKYYEWMILFPFSGEVTKVSCRGAVKRFYVLPVLENYSEFLSELRRRQPTAQRPFWSTYHVNWWTFGSLLTILLLVAVGGGLILLKGFQSPLAPIVVSLVALALFAGSLFLTPLAISVSPEVVSLRYLTHVKRVQSEDIEKVTRLAPWGDYYRILVYSRGRLNLSRSYYNHYDDLIFALEEISKTNEQKHSGG